MASDSRDSRSQSSKKTASAAPYTRLHEKRDHLDEVDPKRHDWRNGGSGASPTGRRTGAELSQLEDVVDQADARSPQAGGPARSLSRPSNEARILSRVVAEGGESILPRLALFAVGLLGSFVVCAFIAGCVWLVRSRGGASDDVFQVPRDASVRFGSLRRTAQGEDRERARAIPLEGNLQEWDVMADAEVRQDKRFVSEILGIRQSGSIVVGAREGDWVKLDHNRGFVRIWVGNPPEELLTLREVAYEVAEGSCEATGRFSVVDSDACDAAGEALGYSPSELMVRLYEGCYLRNARKLSASMAGVPAPRIRPAPGEAPSEAPSEAPAAVRVICSNVSYPKAWVTTTTPTTTSTTTTTTTTTLTTSTSTTRTTTASTSTNTVTRLQPWGFPSMLCWATMEYKFEADLLRSQLLKRQGIFDCDEFAVVSVVVETLGEGPYGTVNSISVPPEESEVVARRLARHAAAGDYDFYPLRALSQPAPANAVDDTVFFGSHTSDSKKWKVNFVSAWKAIGRDGRFRRHDWVVKAEADAVFLPERLRPQLLKHTATVLRRGHKLFLTNCDLEQGPDWPRMFSAVQVLSQAALEVYLAGYQKCWSGWSEDLYMAHCLNLLGVRSIDNIAVLSDKKCMKNPDSDVDCADIQKSAFHPFRTPEQWHSCWMQSALSAKSMG